MSKVAIIGAGSVGSTIANNMVTMGLATEIVLVDVNKSKAYGEALDIYQGVSYCSPAIVRCGDYPAAANADIVIITSGIARKPGQSRLELAQINVNILKDITPKITAVAPNAIYIIVSNPVDVLTYVFHKISGLPENQIIGSGTSLDTARLQAELAKRFRISPRNVHAHVYGEHGDSSFVPWSRATIANNSLEEFLHSVSYGAEINWHKEYEELEEFVRTSGAKVIKNKGATFYAVAISVCHIVKCIKDGAGTALTVGTLMHGEYGIDDVVLSTLAIVDRSGVRCKVTTPLTAEEVDKLQNSANKLKEVIARIDI